MKTKKLNTFDLAELVAEDLNHMAGLMGALVSELEPLLAAANVYHECRIMALTSAMSLYRKRAATAAHKIAKLSASDSDAIGRSDGVKG